MIRVVEADLSHPPHQRGVLDLVDAYSRDPMGAGGPLAPDVRERLIPGLRGHPTTLVFLAERDEEPVGIAACFLGFSTFAARPLVNVHDLAVLPAHRGLGIGRRRREAVEHKARARGGCKVTRGVEEGNRPAPPGDAAAGVAQAP
jgi:GNAT superfamily N-acetyltransferase